MDQVAHELVRDAVIGEPARIARGDEAHPSQSRQLVTRYRQREIQRAREIPHGQLVMRERVHECESDGVRQNLEDFHGLSEHVGCRKAVLGRLDLLRTDYFWERAPRLRYHS